MAKCSVFDGKDGIKVRSSSCRGDIYQYNLRRNSQHQNYLKLTVPLIPWLKADPAFRGS
ncbi:unknown protein [Microcystis aeruginosa NIES-843]|uniref:Uncharacterized protein n=1 Tax=Microcystis aeruginosa (strain NIES-843 / IAM M-2473) TaxID=449447 RepID=B0JPU6_MICAN|nr:unknown protein [Microcystis aeruginosa NIES-843]